MSLSKKAINEFKRIYKQEFGVKLTKDEAKEQSAELMYLVGMLCRLSSKNWFDNQRQDELIIQLKDDNETYYDQ